MFNRTSKLSLVLMLSLCVSAHADQSVSTLNNLIMRLHEIGAIKFGSFVLKSGITSPIYIDLRKIISYPDLLQKMAESYWQKMQQCSYEHVCGVPYTALPIATTVGVAHNKSMVMRRKEAKDHGTKQMIEGAYKKGDVCIVLEDLITSGASIFETITDLEQAGLTVKDAVVFLDRQQGGTKNVTKKGYHVHAICTMDHMLDILLDNHAIDKRVWADTKSFISQHQVIT